MNADTGQRLHWELSEAIIGAAMVVDPKAREHFTNTHLAQMMGSLSITDLRLALLLNFKFIDLRWKRVVR